MKQRAHVLVVDDQADNLLILEDALSDVYDVHPAVNGREALRYLNGGGRADLILLDVMMPEIDGYEVCRRLKSSESTRTIPVLFLTGLDRPEDEERGLELGAEDFIHKPISPPVVRARVRTHLALSRATRALERRNLVLDLLAEQVPQVDVVHLTPMSGVTDTAAQGTGVDFTSRNDDIDKIVHLCKEVIEEDLHAYFEDEKAFIDKMITKRNDFRATLAG